METVKKNTLVRAIIDPEMPRCHRSNEGRSGAIGNMRI